MNSISESDEPDTDADEASHSSTNNHPQKKYRSKYQPYIDLRPKGIENQFHVWPRVAGSGSAVLNDNISNGGTTTNTIKSSETDDFSEQDEHWSLKTINSTQPLHNSKLAEPHLQGLLEGSDLEQLIEERYNRVNRHVRWIQRKLNEASEDDWERITQLSRKLHQTSDFPRTLSAMKSQCGFVDFGDDDSPEGAEARRYIFFRFLGLFEQNNALFY